MSKTICEHGRQKHHCKECHGSQICEHNRQRGHCKECHGNQICEHNRMRNTCRDCKGSLVCEHGRQRRYCKEGECLSWINWARLLIEHARSRSKKAAYPCDLTIEKDGEFIIAQLKSGCPVFKTPYRRDGCQGEDSASLDKFRLDLGYVTGNIFVISMKANAIKNIAKSSKEVFAVANWMKEVEGGYSDV